MAAGTLGTLSVLFTDVVGSTAQRGALGDDAADELQHTHDRLVHEAVEAAGGTVVKDLGDGTMATFQSAADAVAAAVAAQQAIDLHTRRSPGLALHIRIGISIGDVSVDEGDVFGTPVVEAARLCAVAGADEILAAETVRLLARGRSGLTYEPLGAVELRGMAEPLPACRVTWAPEPDAPADVTELPPLLMGTPPTSYIGRDQLMQTLRDTWRQVHAGGVRTVLLAGEPGVGKTRTAAEIAVVAHEDGAVVLFGRCDEDLAVPYQPFVEALDWYIDHTDAPALGRLGGELARLVPDLATRVDGLVAPVESDLRTEEYRLYEAVTGWLVDAAARAGLVFVIDDLHWAAQPTLRLLHHAIRAATAAGSRLLVLGTYRDTDIDRAHPLSSVLADLRRLDGVSRLSIEGLNEDEVVALVEAAAGQELDEAAIDLARAVHDETEGNPFFVAEVLRHLVETGGVRLTEEGWVVAEHAASSVPEGVRDVVGRRVSRLSEDANAVLSVAAVVGRDLELDVVVAACDISEDAVIDALDIGVRARLLEETGADQFRFSHALVRTTLYDELSATRRRRLHRRIAETLEKLHPDDVVALAHHTLNAGPDGGDISRAANYSIAAGEQALDRRALGDAEGHFFRALEMLEDGGDEAIVRHAQCGLGIAQRDQGIAAYRDTLLTAGRSALEAGDIDILSRSVIANARGGLTSVVGHLDEDRVELLEATLAAMGDSLPARRAQVMAMLASELSFSPQHERRQALVAECRALARSLDDPRVLAQVLIASTFAASDGRRVEHMVERARGVVALADSLGDPSLQTGAHALLAAALLGVGELAEARACNQMALEVAARAAPSTMWFARVMAIHVPVETGDIPAATLENDAVFTLGTELAETDAANCWGAMNTTIAMVQRGEGPLADLVGDFADLYPTNEAWRAAHAWFLAAAGRFDEAREAMRMAPPDPEGELDNPMPFQPHMCYAHTAFLLGDRDLAARTQAVLLPYAEHWSHFWLATIGSNALALGLCAATLGELDEAVEWLRTARADCAAQGATANVDQVEMRLAEILLRRGGPGDLDEARQIASELRTRAEAGSAAGLVAAADEVLAAAGS